MLENRTSLIYIGICEWEDFCMEIIREFYGGTSIDSNDVESIMRKGKVELKYYKIISNITNKKNRNQKFGIEVVKKYVNNNIVSEEKKEIFNCIEKEEVADRILELLKVNKVSPINVVDILQDLSAKKKSLLIK